MILLGTGSLEPQLKKEGEHWYTSVLSLVNIISRFSGAPAKEPNTSNFPLYSSSHLFIKFTSSSPCLFLSYIYTHFTHFSLNLFPLRTSDGFPSFPRPPHPSSWSVYTYYKAGASLYFTLYLRLIFLSLFFTAFCERSPRNCVSGWSR